jgi:hypothetical protein
VTVKNYLKDLRARTKLRSGTQERVLATWIIANIALLGGVVLFGTLAFSPSQIAKHQVVLFQSVLVFVPLSISATELLTIFRDATTENVIKKWRPWHVLLQLGVAFCAILVMFSSGSLPLVKQLFGPGSPAILTRAGLLACLLLFAIGNVILNVLWIGKSHVNPSQDRLNNNRINHGQVT